MASINKVILIGNLGQDPELKYIADGKAVCAISLATNEKWKGQDGTPHEKTEWHRIVCWERLAEISAEFLKKGSMAYFEGRLQTRKYQDKAGVDRSITEIRADRMQMLGDPRPRASAADHPDPEPTRPPTRPATRPAPREDVHPAFANMDDDIPF